MSARTVPRPAQRGVGISLIAGDETTAIIDQFRRTQSAITIADRGVYLKADAPDQITIDLADLTEQLARPIDVEDVLIVIASYYGEIEPQRGATPGTGSLVLRADAPLSSTPGETA